MLLWALLPGCAATPVAAPSTVGVSTATTPTSAAPMTVSATGGTSPTIVLPPTTGRFDYQLGGAYPPPTGVTVVARDRTARPAQGVYSICYVNGFQAQPDARAFWLGRHPDLVLTDARGRPVVDEDWDELLLDTRTAALRAAIAGIVGEWIEGCARSGFQAVELDNLDSYERSQGLIRARDNVAMMAAFSERAHASGLAVAQKNAVELVGRRASLGTDFAVVEECNRYAECGAYADSYGSRVYVIEYTEAAFARGCRDFAGLMIVRRDLDLAPAGTQGHVYRQC